MSRLIVKNLPKNASESKLRSLFSEKGTITDIQLKFKDGKFRQFAFVGYENSESAQDAVNFFNDTFIGTNKVKVEICATLEAKKSEDVITKKSTFENTKELKKATIDDVLNEYKDDVQFQEFMKTNAKDKLQWENDLGIVKDNNQAEGEEEETSKSKLADLKISDKDYKKKLMGDSTEDDEEIKESKNSLKLYTVKIRNIPKKIKREELKKFFRPSKAHSIRIPKNQLYACAYVGFKLERDMKRALLKDKSFLRGKQVHVYEFTNKIEEEICKKNVKNSRWQEQEEKLRSEENICDSGKLFFRNLPYTATEDDVQKLFEKFGSVSEVNVPIDSVSRKNKGYGTITFLLPQNALEAYTALNGTMFQGRMFHILPGKAQDRNPSQDDSDNKNFKDKKLKDLKKASTQAYNWNTLFMGTNAVSEAIAKKYGKSKEEVLESSTGGSGAAVRLALGETQVILEMKNFLESHGVRLDVFEKDAKKRSKTIILVKNLPTSADVEELRAKFSAYGLLEKIILPPNGITCLIKFADPSEARKAFKSLAYTKYKHMPLYLEWAPENTFRSKEEEIQKIDEVNNDKKEVEETIIEENRPPENNSTLYIKNLNISTTEETLEKIFNNCGTIHSIQIVKMKNLSLAYGFIQYKLSTSADKALKNLQHKIIDGNKIDLKRSDRTTKASLTAERKDVKNQEQKESTKIMVRNIPFQANIAEIRLLFQTFGEIKAIRLPKKSTPGVEQHRGFGFVDFVNKSDAKNAFNALHHSTHLYGRRLVLEWAATEENVDEIRKRTAYESLDKISDPSQKRQKKGWLKDENFMNGNDNEIENL